MTTLTAGAPDKALSYFPTPPEVAHLLLANLLEPWMSNGEGVRFLEPSAGAGHLAAELRARMPASHITCLEPEPERAAGLRERTIRARAVREGMTYSEICGAPIVDRPVADVVLQTTLEDYLAAGGPAEPFHGILANPPFTLPGRRLAWAEHLLVMWEHPGLLAEWGTMSAVVPHILATGGHRLVREVRELAEANQSGVLPHIYEMPRGAFKSSGAAVHTVGVWLEKPACELKQETLW